MIHLSEKLDLPIITVGIVVLNREWIIRKMLTSLLSQTYPHRKIFVLIVDGGSKDNTPEIARKLLENADFNGYAILVKKGSIPEGRNICIEQMHGDLLFFWDSDVIMENTAIEELLKTLKEEKAAIATAHASFLYVSSLECVTAKMSKHPRKNNVRNYLQEVPTAGMGHTLVKREVLNSVRFDPDLTILEDFDFSLRAREKGFKIVMNKNIQVFDVNMLKEGHSDIHIDMPVRNAMKGIRKKSRVQVLSCSSSLTFSDFGLFFLKNKRYLFYLGYLPMVGLLLLGIFHYPFLVFFFLAYCGPYLIWQFKRRGVKRGLKAILLSFVVGLPTSLWLVYFFSKYIVLKK